MHLIDSSFPSSTFYSTKKAALIDLAHVQPLFVAFDFHQRDALAFLQSTRQWLSLLCC